MDTAQHIDTTEQSDSGARPGSIRAAIALAAPVAATTACGADAVGSGPTSADPAPATTVPAETATSAGSVDDGESGERSGTAIPDDVSSAGDVDDRDAVAGTASSLTAGSPSAVVVIESDLDIGHSVVTGTFVVSSGADALGCSAGRLFVTDVAEARRSTMTCESGNRTGSFVVELRPEAIAEDRFAGPWEIDSGTGDFEGLRGSGELSAERDIPTLTLAQTLTGTIEG